MIFQKIGLAVILILGFLGCRMAMIIRRAKIATILLLLIATAIPSPSYAALPECIKAPPKGTQEELRHIHVLFLIRAIHLEDGERRVDLFEPPAGLGISQKCMREIHIHNPDGILHIESFNKDKVFTFGDFLDLLWFERKLSLGDNPKVLVGGEEIKDYSNVILTDGMSIIVEYDLTKTPA